MSLVAIALLVPAHSTPSHASLGAAQTTPQRSSRWWFQTHTSEYTTQAIEIVTTHRSSITGAYFYSGFHIGPKGAFSSPTTAVVKQRTAPFLALGLTVGVALSLDQSAVEDGSVVRGVAAATVAARDANLTSLMIDYEPKTNISRAHAVAYAAFVAALAAALHADGRSLEMCVSSWGILTHFRLYAATRVDGMMSMAATYSGADVPTNEGWVAKELSQTVSFDQLRVGVGSTNAIHQKWDYHWSDAKMSAFTSWLITQGVRHLDVWRTDIDTLNATDGTAPWLYDATARFLQQPSCTPPAAWTHETCGAATPPGTPPCCGAARCANVSRDQCGGPPAPPISVCTAPSPPPIPKCASVGDPCDDDDDCCPDIVCHSIVCAVGKCSQRPPPPLPP